MTTRDLTGDELDALRDQRDFLLRSLEDLEAEHAAGDVDDHDYEVLKEDYTVRAARVLRAIETHQARESDAGTRRSGWQAVAVAFGVVAFAVGAGVLVAQTAGTRGAGDGVTGDIRTTTRTELNRAMDLASTGDLEASLGVYEEILDEQPENVEAMTYRGWVQTLSGDLMGGVESLTAASELNPDYPDAHALLAVTYLRAARSDPELEDVFLDFARERLVVLDELEVRAEIEMLLEPVRAELE